MHPAHVLDVVGGRAVHSGRAGTPVGPHPLPGHGQHSRIDDQVEQVVEPATRLRTCPPVQLRLDLQYPLPGHHRWRERRAGIHQRPPDIPVLRLRTRCRPWPCDRLSRPRTTTAAPPQHAPLSRRWACPGPAWLAGDRRGRALVPTFTVFRSTGSAPSYSPTASPRLTRSTSSWPPARPTHDLTEVATADFRDRAHR